MHDLMLGVLKYDIRAILRHYINGGIFNLSDLNYRLKHWIFPNRESFKLEFENETVKLKAREVWFFVENMPLLFSGLVPNDRYCDFICTVHDLQEILLQPYFYTEQFGMIEALIKEHHTFFLNHFEPLKPKFHLLLHYVEMIKASGPVKHLMCFRIEAKHQELKAYAKVCHSRRNLSVTLANKMAFKFANFLYSYNKNVLTEFNEIKQKGLKFLPEEVATFIGSLYGYGIPYETAKTLSHKGTIFSVDDYILFDNLHCAGLCLYFVLIGQEAVCVYKTLEILYKSQWRCFEIGHAVNEGLQSIKLDEIKYEPSKKQLIRGRYFIKKVKKF